jgi:linoleoyl-CoA desaturase
MTHPLASRRVHFQGDGGLHAAVRQKVAAELSRRRLPRWGGASMHAKTGLILGWFAVSYAGLLLLGGISGWIAVALTVSLALATAGIGFSVMHDANHGAYSSSRRVNRAVGLALDFVGASSYLWRFKHNVQHHTYTNVDGMDADVDAGPFLRLAPTQRLRALHRFQHLYAWALYGVLAVKWWFVDDLLDLALGRSGNVRIPRPRGGDLAALLAGKAVFVGWSLVVPALLFPARWTIPLFLLGAFILGVVLSTVFQLAHTVPQAEMHAAEPGERWMRTGWAEHQARTTVDFAPTNRLLSWYVGGLNFQLEHHLLPDVCHVHYPSLAAVVAAACEEYGVPHRTAPSLRAAIASHYRHLRALGRRCAAAPDSPLGGIPAPRPPGPLMEGGF